MKERAAALEQIPLLREEAKGIKEGQLASMEAQLRDAETRLEASVKVRHTNPKKAGFAKS
jgi:hypothetical protein